MNAIQHVQWTRSSGGIATIYYCPFCKPSRPFMVRVPKGIPGVGRGYGMASSSRARAEVAKHIREHHADHLVGVVVTDARAWC